VPIFAALKELLGRGLDRLAAPIIQSRAAAEPTIRHHAADVAALRRSTSNGGCGGAATSLRLLGFSCSDTDEPDAAPDPAEVLLPVGVRPNSVSIPPASLRVMDLYGFTYLDPEGLVPDALVDGGMAHFLTPLGRAWSLGYGGCG
jgi:hypothetical protein